MCLLRAGVCCLCSRWLCVLEFLMVYVCCGLNQCVVVSIMLSLVASPDRQAVLSNVQGCICNVVSGLVAARFV